jgi:hypothetical protein
VKVTKVKVQDMRKRRRLSMQEHLATVSDDSVIESIPMQVQVSSIPQMELKMEPIQDMQMQTTQQMYTTQEMSVAQQNHHAFSHFASDCGDHFERIHFFFVGRSPPHFRVTVHLAPLSLSQEPKPVSGRRRCAEPRTEESELLCRKTVRGREMHQH